LLAQAEHDPGAQSILMTDDAALADAVEKAVTAQLTTLPRGVVAGASWRDFGAIFLVRALDDAIPLVDALAPEHLEIETADPERLAAKIRNAGAIFLGAHTPEAIGDYCRRLQPRAADGPLGAVFFRARRSRLHETHVDPEMRPGAARRPRPRWP
jgi:histidinol dehydrogenase